VPSALSVQTRDDGEATTLILAGDLDLASVKTLEVELEAQWRTDAQLVVVDLRSVGFVDSSGLRALITAALTAEQLGRRLAVLGGPDKAQRLHPFSSEVRGLTVVDRPEQLHDTQHWPRPAEP
jgi:anti-anti-sigma factor